MPLGRQIGERTACNGLSSRFSTPAAGTGQLPRLSKWPFGRSSARGKSSLINLQELLDPLDILRKYAGIRIQDLYNTMLRNGWTLGSPQLMKVLQLVMRMHHGRTVKLLEARWKATQPDMVVSFVPHFNRALGESLSQAFPGRPFVTVLTDLADYPPHFWIERQPQYLDLRFGPRRCAGALDGASGRPDFPRLRNDPAPAVLRGARRGATATG